MAGCSINTMVSADPGDRSRPHSRARRPSRTQSSISPAAPSTGDLRPPKFTIDLSLPPEQRYLHLVPQFQPLFSVLPSLFSELLGDFGLSEKWTTRLARVFLRRVGSHEETRELRGLSRATNIPMYLLVALNVLLDLFMVRLISCVCVFCILPRLESHVVENGAGSYKN